VALAIIGSSSASIGRTVPYFVSPSRTLLLRASSTVSPTYGRYGIGDDYCVSPSSVRQSTWTQQYRFGICPLCTVAYRGSVAGRARISATAHSVSMYLSEYVDVLIIQMAKAGSPSERTSFTYRRQFLGCFAIHN
jgi:hypothetical protein